MAKAAKGYEESAQCFSLIYQSFRLKLPKSQLHINRHGASLRELAIKLSKHQCPAPERKAWHEGGSAGIGRSPQAPVQGTLLLVWGLEFWDGSLLFWSVSSEPWTFRSTKNWHRPSTHAGLSAGLLRRLDGCLWGPDTAGEGYLAPFGIPVALTLLSLGAYGRFFRSFLYNP